MTLTRANRASDEDSDCFPGAPLTHSHPAGHVLPWAREAAGGACRFRLVAALSDPSSAAMPPGDRSPRPFPPPDARSPRFRIASPGSRGRAGPERETPSRILEVTVGSSPLLLEAVQRGRPLANCSSGAPTLSVTFLVPVFRNPREALQRFAPTPARDSSDAGKGCDIPAPQICRRCEVPNHRGRSPILKTTTGCCEDGQMTRR
jgi:hypothetical protein